MLKVTRCQRAVGQGFFHSAAIETEDAKFHYVYDCGSENGKPRNREILDYTPEVDGQIDILFLSHLHMDHVNGLDRLLSLTKAHTVVLPYLTVFERILLAAGAVEAGRISSDYIQLISDPAAWFFARNVARVMFVNGGGDESGELGFDYPAPNDDPPQSKDYRRSDIQLDDMKFLPYRLENRAGVGRDNASYAIPHDIPFELSVSIAGKYKMIWVLLPFVHPEYERQKVFLRKFRTLFGEPLPVEKTKSRCTGLRQPQIITDWLRDTIQDPIRRHRLVEAYSEINSNLNLTSMSLYSGPTKDLQGMFLYFATHRRGYYKGRTSHCAWLGTGDANLLNEPRRTAFLQHYRDLLHNVGTITLPHHGSKHNFSDAIIPPNARICPVSVGAKNKYHHPHYDVVRAVAGKGRDLLKVTESKKSRIRETISFDPDPGSDLALD